MVKNGKIRQLLSEFRTGLEALYGLRLKGLYLFGSYARREEDVESDVDVLIVLDHFTSYCAEIDRSGYLTSELSLKYGVTISRVFVTEEKWTRGETSFLANVREDAVVA